MQITLPKSVLRILLSKGQLWLDLFIRQESLLSSQKKKAKEEILVNSLSMLCPFEPEEKQVLLEAETIVNRLDVLVALMQLSSENDLENQYIQ